MVNLMDDESRRGAGYRLGLTRQALGISQAEICREIDVSPSNWNNVERGRSWLGHDALIRFCRRFQINTEWLMRGNIQVLPADLRRKITRLRQENDSKAERA